MKKLHKLILQAFFAPFLVTFSVVVFVLLMVTLAKYTSEITGKGIPASSFIELFFYFSFNSTQLALPLAILLSALMTYGSLGQHNELIAVKSSGISLIRIITPLFFAVLLIAIGDFFFNDYVLPRTNIKAYNLLYDMRHKKPDFSLKEKVFYAGIPGYSIRVDEKEEETGLLKKVLIHDHSKQKGNIEVISADSGKMYTLNEGGFLVLELFDGIRSAEEHEEGKPYEGSFSRTKFSKTKMVFDLTSFQMKRTPEELFSKNRRMLTIKELENQMDTVSNEIASVKYDVLPVIKSNHILNYVDTANYTSASVEVTKELPFYERKIAVKSALNIARRLYSHIDNKASYERGRRRSYNRYGIEKLHNYTNACACLVMFLIGAPLGVVIKKGGMGIPALITIAFFIMYYIVSITGEKFAKSLTWDFYSGTWLSNVALLPFAFYFMYLAYKDAKVF